MRTVDCVGALIQDRHHRVYVHRRSPTRRLFPGIWDIVGGHLESGETPSQALAREVEEETGWTVRSIRWPVADWEWEYEGRVRRELDFVVEVDGDLDQPALEAGKHDASAWVGPDNLELMMVGRTDGDRRLRDIVAHVARTRFTERLRLEPVTGPGEVLTGHQADLERLFADPWVARWYAGTWSAEQSLAAAKSMHAAWERDQVGKWVAYAGEAFVGRGGLSRLGVDNPVTAAIGELAGQAWLADRLELGWALLGAARGRGYATEIGRAGLEYAFGTVGSPAVVAFTEVVNTASRAVMERLGMTLLGEIRAEGWHAGEIRPDAPFAVYLATR